MILEDELAGLPPHLLEFAELEISRSILAISAAIASGKPEMQLTLLAEGAKLRAVLELAQDLHTRLEPNRRPR